MKKEAIKHFQCNHCDSPTSENLMCCDCWTDLAGCDCYDDLGIWNMQILCGDCGNVTDIDTRDIDEKVADELGYGLEDEDEWSDDMLEWLSKKNKQIEPLQPTTSVVTTGGTKSKAKVQTQTFMKCRHYDIPMQIAQGVMVYPSSMNNDSPEKRNTSKDRPHVLVPDFGLYADKGWLPAWRNEFVTFPDFGIPTYGKTAITQITEAAERAANGEIVELGCIGGHGRTGTMLACMFLWGAERDGKPISGEEACELVWYFYCEEAIESKIQEWWVSYYGHIQFGYELPEKPKAPAPKWKAGNTSTGGDFVNVCQVRDHLEMMAAGAKECLRDIACKYWEEDQAPGVEPMPEEPIRQWEIAKYKNKIASKNAITAISKKGKVQNG